MNANTAPKECNADLCTTATQNSPRGHNPVHVWRDRDNGLMVTTFRDGAPFSAIRPRPYHIIRYWGQTKD